MDKFDPHKKYKRIGECNRCGRCCDLYCKFLRWKVNRDLKAGEEFIETGINGSIMAICTVNPKPTMCADFPTSHWQTLKYGFRWVEVIK
jgi:hypothetical protein